mgnify:CR=1 FL=1
MGVHSIALGELEYNEQQLQDQARGSLHYRDLRYLATPWNTNVKKQFSNTNVNSTP